MIASRAVLLPAIFLWFAVGTFSAQESSPPVTIHVAAQQRDAPSPTVWNYFGYDEPNYTYAPHGRKLLSELARLSRPPVYVRVHNLFTTGDGTASLKWGSTNVYTQDSAGKPVYSWQIVDQIFDTFHNFGIKPLVELGFMPMALSIRPQPYRHHFPEVTAAGIYTGWAYPPNNYEQWSELVFEFVRHLRQRYGDAELRSWLWEVWNEPDIGYWQGTPEEYFKLYDFSAAAVVRAFPQARIGGPDSTGPVSNHAAEFLRSFLDHCARGRNYATGKVGAQLDFISFHPKGAPEWKGDHVQMGISHQLRAIEEGFKIVQSFPEWRKTPVVLGESDPEGCAACSAKTNPQNSYRNGPLYACYEAEVLSDTLALAAQQQTTLMGAVTWAFEFEGQPYFEGFRTLATNGVDKPVLNAFRMFGMLSDDRVQVTSSGALPLDDIVRNGVRSKPDVGALATRRDREVDVVLWNYHDDDLPAPDSAIDLSVDGLSAGPSRLLLQHFRIDSTHSNAFAAWKKMGSPQSPTAEQYQALEAAGQLQSLDSPEWINAENASVRLKFSLPRQALSLIRLSW